MTNIYLVLENERPLCAFYEKKAAYDFVASSLAESLTGRRSYCVRTVEIFGDETTPADDREAADRTPFLRRFM